MVPFIPLGILRERSGFNRFPYSIFKGDKILNEVLWLPLDHQLLRYHFGPLFSGLAVKFEGNEIMSIDDFDIFACY